MQKSLSNKEKVLVVDDEASIRRILDTRLSMIGYLVIKTKKLPNRSLFLLL